jgi:RluA family pseudouridine synthase
VVYEDEVMIAFDKPSGLPMAPDPFDRTKENLMEMVHGALGKQVANVHRLDTDVSGVVLCSKNKVALDFLSGQFQSKTADGTYLALVIVQALENVTKIIEPIRDEMGRLPDSFLVEVPIGEDFENPGLMRAYKKRGGHPSLSEFRTLERFGNFALVECHPRTGRPHQLRVHLAAAGAPLLNDHDYGDPSMELRLSSLKRGYKGRADEKPLVRRLALHASGLTVTHPETREKVTLNTTLPKDFEVALKYLRAYGNSSRGRERR